MNPEVQFEMENYVEALGKLLDSTDPQTQREAMCLLKTFDIMMHAMETLDGLYTGREMPGWHGGRMDQAAQAQQPPPHKLCNCGLSEKIEDRQEDEFFGKKICDATCMQSAVQAQGDVAEYIKFLSEETDEKQTEADLNEAVEDISSFVDVQLGIKTPEGKPTGTQMQVGAMSGTPLENEVKIQGADDMENLIKKRKEERGEDLKREREKIKAAKNNPVDMEFKDLAAQKEDK